MKIDMACFRGDTTEWDITIVKGGLPVDLTSAKIWMTAQRGLGGPQIFQRATGGLGIVIDPDQTTNPGKAVIKLAADSTSGLPSETVTLIYDIQYKIGSDILTASYGNLVVTPDVTLDIA